ncbi:MAG: hypothetical protein RR365_11155 [Bacteroides sp.]
MKDRSIRFLKVVDVIGDNDSLVCKNIGIKKETLSKVRTNVQDASIETITKFCCFYTNANANYILTGIGEPIIGNDNIDGISIGRDNIGSVTGDSNIVNNNLSNVGNTRHYEVPKKGFLKIIHPDGSEEDIAGDAGLLEALNENKMLRLENDYLKGIVKDKDKMIILLEKSLKEK